MGDDEITDVNVLAMAELMQMVNQLQVTVEHLQVENELLKLYISRLEERARCA